MTKARRKLLAELFTDLTRRCEQWREWDELLREAEQGERKHRSMGKRFTNGAAKCAESVSLAVYYFACKCVLEPIALPESWEGVAGYRRDYVIGQGLRRRAETVAPLTELELRWNELALDYSVDIVGRA